MARKSRIDAIVWLILLLGLVTTALGVAYGVAVTPNAPAVARFLSEGDDLRLVSGDWHHYHLTSVDGKLVWLYTRHRFDGSLATNSLRTRIDVLDSAGEAFPYEVEVGLAVIRGFCC